MLMARVTSRKFFLQSFVAWKSTSASESLQREFELHNRDVPDSFKGTAFAASKRGCFFQEAPRLRNQFTGDLFLQSYLKRILPQEVGMCSIYGQLIQYKSVFFVIIFNLTLFKLIFYLKSCHVLTTSIKFDSAGLERDGSVFVCKGQHSLHRTQVSILRVWFPFLKVVQQKGHVLSRQFYIAAWCWVNYLLTFLA